MPSTPAARKYASSHVPSRNHAARNTGVAAGAREGPREHRVDLAGGRLTLCMRRVVQRIQLRHRELPGGQRCGGGHGRGVVVQRIAQPRTPVIQSPRSEEQQIKRGRPDDRAADDTPRAEASWPRRREIAHREQEPRRGDGGDEHVEQSERHQVRRRGQEGLHGAVHRAGVPPLDSGRGQRQQRRGDRDDDDRRSERFTRSHLSDLLHAHQAVNPTNSSLVNHLALAAEHLLTGQFPQRPGWNSGNMLRSIPKALKALTVP